MDVRRRKLVALVPNCLVLETRLALSGNFLSHGFADVARSVDHLEHHHAEHSTMKHATAHTEPLKVHYDHIVETASTTK